MDLFPLLFTSFLLLISSSHALSHGGDHDQTKPRQTYIVHVSPPEPTTLKHSSSDQSTTTVHQDLESWYRSFIPISSRNVASSGSSTSAGPRMLYPYKNVMSGFAARLSKEEVEAMRMKDGFVSARRQRVYRKQTTHTPEFLGLQMNFGVLKDSNSGEGVIIAVLDTGVSPSHPSFRDDGIPPPPSKWKGRCEISTGCNNKLIGVRAFDVEGNNNTEASAVDDDGHGTHTASTAAGAYVDYADVLGNARGTAAGMATRSHLAIYRVCFGEDCAESNILAGIDAAVDDGVDVISLSLGEDPVPFYEDAIAVGSFAAMQKGIFVSCSAANAGPLHGTLSNEAPWVLTVGASTVDRRIEASVKLGNRAQYSGETIARSAIFHNTSLPLVYAGANGKQDSAFCANGSLNGVDVKNKAVLCERGGGIPRIAKGEEVRNTGGAAMILMNGASDGFTTIADVHVIPAVHVSYAAGQRIKAHINSSATVKPPTVALWFKGTVIGDKSAPAVASFSSRGPSVVTPGILKPDIIGPGVSILAAWPFSVDNTTHQTNTFFNIMSGTSMSCPHLAGIAALLKSSHPTWSPAAIKSAIMTTADLLNLAGKPFIDEQLQPADIFATGAGHVNPSKANDPGLIYDIHPDDYIPYLCGLNYTDQQVGILAHRLVNCSEYGRITEAQLNYPSFSVVLGPNSQTFSRTVTNVGGAISTYVVSVVAPEWVTVKVSPSVLQFAAVNHKATYWVTFTAKPGYKSGSFAQGYINWATAKHSVRSPIAVQFK